MKKFLLILSFTSTTLLAQVSENLADGDIVSNPAWSGDLINFEVLTGELHLNAPAISDVSYLSTPSESINNAQWEIYVRLEFNPSSSNYAKIYLVSDSSNLEGELNGYFVRVGSTADDISLMRQDGLSQTTLVDGADGILNTSPVDVNIKVIRDDAGNWELLSDVANTGVYLSEGTVFDDQHIKSSFFGIVCNYTSTRSDKFFYDNIEVSGDPWVDFSPPELLGYEITSLNTISLFFDEAVSETSVIPSNFSVNGNSPSSALLDLLDPFRVNLEFTFTFSNGFYHELSYQNVSDPLLNMGGLHQLSFLYFERVQAGKGDIVINEVFPDPSPVIQLPESEFLEIYNTSNSPFQLSGWVLSDGSTFSTLDSALLLPDSILILSPSSYHEAYSTYGTTLAVSPWPSQNNSGDILVLKDETGSFIDSVSYSASWYGDEDKKSGGYSIERINPLLDCNISSNWRASESDLGGTPGVLNSIYTIEPDTIAPQVISAAFISPKSICVNIDEPVLEGWQESLTLTLNPFIAIDSVLHESGSLSFFLYLKDSIDSETQYNISFAGPVDCSGNILSSEFQLQLDFLPPRIVNLNVLHPNELLIRFDEAPIPNSFSISHFEVAGASPTKVSVEDSLTISLVFDIEFHDKALYSLLYSDVQDIYGNKSNSIFEFQYKAPPEPSFLDILVTEIMVDPEPGLGILPNSQYIEIYNTSNTTFSLKGMHLGDAVASTTIRDGLIEGSAYILLTPSTQKDNFDVDNSVGVLSWPSFNKGEDNIILANRHGELLHTLNYSRQWYKDSDKSEGGWSLEMVDTNNPCGEINNWTASEHISGGTPGMPNSLQSTNPDNFPPVLHDVFAFDSVTIYLTFSEFLDPNNIPEVAITPHIEISLVQFFNDSYQEILLKLASPLQARQGYRIFTTASDCNSNSGLIESEEFYLPEKGEKNDIIINELLFNPVPGGVDFVELYNYSKKYLLIQNWSIASYTQSAVHNSGAFSANHKMLGPGEFIVLTSDKTILSNQYPDCSPNAILEASLPSMPDDFASIVVTDEHGIVIDSTYYHEDWHHPLLETNEGVSLERRNYDLPSTDSNNWKSAASTSGFATPGKINSQLFEVGQFDSRVEVFPELFFPGTGGKDALLTIEYSFDKPDLVATVNIFSVSGARVRRLATQQLLSSNGIFTWDGINDHGNKVPVGHYFIVVDVFAPNGYKERVRRKAAVGVRR